MNRIPSIIINIITTGLVALLTTGLFSIFLLDILQGDESFFGFLAMFFITGFMIFMIHITVYLPSLFIFKDFIVANDATKVFRRFIPVLFLLFLIYAAIAFAIFVEEGSGEEEFLPLVFILGSIQYFVHSIGLYTLINRVKNNFDSLKKIAGQKEEERVEV